MQTKLFPTTVYLMSGGVSSTLAAYYHRQQHPERDYIYYFNDTLIEHESTYRFLIESLYFLEKKKISSKVAYLVKRIPPLEPGLDIQVRTKHLDVLFNSVCNDTGLVRVRYVDPWAVFEKECFIGNTRIDVCSKYLKRIPRQAFTNALEGEVEICLGLTWAEVHRLDKALVYEPNIIAPLIELGDTIALWDKFHQKSGIQKAEAYSLGFAHDNCGGMCVKAGQAQFKKLWLYRRDVYLWHEERMNEIMRRNPNLKPFLRKTINGELCYLTLKEYREQFLEPEVAVDEYDFGGCGCALY